MKDENGFKFNEYPCASGKPDALIIFLHGHANHPDMFSQLPAEMQKAYPNADVLIVCGPVLVDSGEKHRGRDPEHGINDLYTWYKVGNKPEQTLELAISHLFNRVPVVDQLNKFADAQLAKRGLNDDKLVLFGFSLGGAMTVQMGCRRDNECAAVICHSGPVLPIIQPKSKPNTLIVMGDQDPLFYTTSRTVQAPEPKKRTTKALKKVFDKALESISIHYNASLMRLKKSGATAKGVVVKGMSHTINEESFKHSIDFIVDRLSPPPPPEPPAPAAPKP